MTENPRQDDALFVNLILIFQSAAMQQMGKTINPLTSKVDRNLEQARFSIDTLAMLRDKTRGNLSEDLETLLDSTLLHLRMNYVEEAAADEKAAEEQSGGEAPPPAAGAGPASEAGAGQRPADEKQGHAEGTSEPRKGEDRKKRRGGEREKGQ